jgi:hypothetical protein
MKDMRDVTHKDKLLMGKNRISGNISFNVGRVIVNDGEKEIPEMRYAIGYFFRYRFWEQFSLNATFYQDFNPRAAARWTSNFTYSLARYNWKPNRFNFGYENYLNNRYSDDLRTLGEKFSEGYYFLSYGHLVKLGKLKIDESSTIKVTYFARHALKYRDEFQKLHGGLGYGKTSLGAGFRYTIGFKIYVEAAAYYYVEENLKKQPWDPDYTYGFGYFDYRSFRLSLTYGNWAVNRFPWNKTYYKNYGLMDGNFRIIANWIW